MALYSDRYHSPAYSFKLHGYLPDVGTVRKIALSFGIVTVLFFVSFISSFKSFVMTILHQLDKWSITHPRLLLLLRVALGNALPWKGISFISDMMSLKTLLSQSNFSFLPDWIALVITWIHLLCGFIITIGLFTRLSALVQTPFLSGRCSSTLLRAFRRRLN